jgi:hypothetical protein
MLWIRGAFYKEHHNFGKPVIFGHSPFTEPQVFRDIRPGHQNEIVAIGIDTMFHNVGMLTAVALDPEHPHAAPTFYASPAVGDRSEERT